MDSEKSTMVVTNSEENMMQRPKVNEREDNSISMNISENQPKMFRWPENQRALEILREGKNATLDENILTRITELCIKKKDDIKTTKAWKKTKNEKKAKKSQQTPLKSFKWPQDADIMEKLRTNQTETKLESELEHRLDDFGLVRKSSEPEANADKPLSVRARQTGRMLGRNKVR